VVTSKSQLVTASMAAIAAVSSPSRGPVESSL